MSLWVVRELRLVDETDNTPETMCDFWLTILAGAMVDIFLSWLNMGGGSGGGGRVWLA